ncbi:MAG: tetratricopeptide repeat protein [Acidobacteriota bacterium]|jgi:hypothetical protein
MRVRLVAGILAPVLCAAAALPGLLGADVDAAYAQALRLYRSGAMEAALAALEPALTTTPPREGAWILQGWILLRLGRVAEADSAFARALEIDPGAGEARTGRGHAALRSGRPDEALEWFRRVLEADPGQLEARRGEILALERLGRPDEALAALEALLEDLPGDPALEAAAARIRQGPPRAEARPRPPAAASVTVRPAVRARGRYLEIPDGPDAFRPIFVRGVNLGLALPGRFPTEFPREPALYRDWLERIAAMNANAVRTYTLLPPQFYDALAAHNREHPDRPLWLLQGAWVERPPADDFGEAGFREAFRREIERVIDAYHGNLDLPPRPGHASGRYRADVSRHVLGLILGREWEPFSVVAYDERHPGTHSHEGRFARLASGSAMEAWLAWTCDAAMAYETGRYRVQRPVAFSNWPTLDPLHHPTETSRAEENALRRAQGEEVAEKEAPQYDDDAVAVDAERIRPGPDNHAGLFASYHVYPYHPDFMLLQADYREAVDAEGPSPYFGYLRELKQHHRDQPLLVAELGVPTGRGVAHVHPLGWDHGGHGAAAQGAIDARLLRDVREAGCAGGVVFEWMDEWFKRNWMVADLEIPPERDPLWHNLLDPEEGFGILAARAAGGPRLDGSASDWSGLAGALEADWTPPSGACVPGFRRAAAAADAAYLHLLVEMTGMDCDADGAVDWDRRRIVVGIDTYAPELGERRLEPEDPLELPTGVEFRVRLQGPGASDLQAVPSYDVGRNLPDGPFRPRATAEGAFVALIREANRRRIGRDGTVYPAVLVDGSPLHFADGAATETSDVAVGLDGDAAIVELRLPWNLLNVTDPSSHRVLDQAARHGPPFETAETDGFRFHLSLRDGGGKPLDAATLGPFLWDGWEVPRYELEPKASYDILRRVFAELEPLGEDR